MSQRITLQPSEHSLKRLVAVNGSAQAMLFLQGIRLTTFIPRVQAELLGFSTAKAYRTIHCLKAANTGTDNRVSKVGEKHNLSTDSGIQNVTDA